MKKVIKVIAFLLITVISITYIYGVLSWKDTTGEYLSATQQLYATEDDLIDVVFMGSSHCYCGINPSVLWETYGISAFDMSVSGQDKNSTYYSLKEVLKTQSPKVVCIDLWGIFYEEHMVESNVYRNMLAMKTSSNSIDLVQSYVDEEERMDYYLRWPIIHTRYRELTEYDFLQYELSIYGRGFNASFKRNPAPPIDCSVKESSTIGEENKKWIDDLKQLSEEEDFELIMFFAPTSLNARDQKVLNGVADYLDKQEIAFVNFNHLVEETGLDVNADFSDNTHLNTYGAEKITSYFGEYLVENYEFTDHRGDEQYYLWDECSSYLEHKAFENELQNKMELEEYLDKIAEFEDLTVVISLDGNYQDSTLNLKAVTDSFGISEPEYYLGGKWIYENGNIIYYMNNGVAEQYTYELSETQTLRLWNVSGSLHQIAIDGEPMSSVYNGLSVVVYDKYMNRVIDKRGYF